MAPGLELLPLDILSFVGVVVEIVVALVYSVCVGSCSSREGCNGRSPPASLPSDDDDSGDVDDVDDDNVSTLTGSLYLSWRQRWNESSHPTFLYFLPPRILFQSSREVDARLSHEQKCRGGVQGHRVVLASFGACEMSSNACERASNGCEWSSNTCERPSSACDRISRRLRRRGRRSILRPLSLRWLAGALRLTRLRRARVPKRTQIVVRRNSSKAKAKKEQQ